MIISLTAYDAERKPMQNFCITYRGILSKSTPYATDVTGRLTEEVANLNVHKYLTGHLGGMQQMATQTEHNRMDLVTFLRDPQNPKLREPDISDMVRLCDTYNIPLATDLAFAELFIETLDRGDMEW